MERRKGSNKVLYRDVLAQGQRRIHFTVFLTRKAFLSYTAVHVAFSLKPLSRTLCGPLDLISGINNKLMFEIHVLISLTIFPSRIKVHL